MKITELTVPVLVERAKRLNELKTRFAPGGEGITEAEMREMDGLETLFGWEGARLALLLETAERERDTAVELLSSAHQLFAVETKTDEALMDKIDEFLVSLKQHPSS